MARPAGVSAQAHVGDGHVDTIGNGGGVGWVRDVAEEIRLVGKVLVLLLALTMSLTRSIARDQALGRNGVSSKETCCIYGEIISQASVFDGAPWVFAYFRLGLSGSRDPYRSGVSGWSPFAISYW
jgi:hypothetical protein